MSSVFQRIATHPRSALFCAFVAFAMTLPMLGIGYYLDDQLHTFILDGGTFPGGPWGPWDLYRFADGGEQLREATRQGFFPWWSSPDLRLSFFRPLPSLWRALDHQLFGHSALIPHLESSLAFAGATYVAWHAYNTILKPGEPSHQHSWRFRAPVGATLAALMFAVDDAHSLSVSWVANRYALVVALFGFASIAVFAKRKLHDGPLSRSSLTSAGLFALALASGETALAALGYLVALALLFFPTPSGRKRACQALAPHFVVLGGWAILYRNLGYGAGGGAFYIDPLRSPGAFAGAVVERFPRLLLGQFFAPPSEVWTLVPGAAGGGLIALTIVLAIIVLAFVYSLAWNHPSTLALLLGTLLATLPVCAMTPDDRLLLMPGFGAFAILAIGIERVWRNPRYLSRPVPVGDTMLRPDKPFWFGYVFAYLLMFLHIVVAPILLPVRALGFSGMLKTFIAQGEATIPRGDALVGKTLIIVTTPDVLMTNYMMLGRMARKEQLPRVSHILSAQEKGTAIIERDSQSSLIVRNAQGENGGPFGGVYRREPFVVGHKTSLDGVEAEVLETDAEGKLTTARFSFDRPMDEYLFLMWKGAGFVPLELAVGEKTELQVVSFQEALNQ